MIKMYDEKTVSPTPADSIEPHASLLTIPEDGSLLYKIIPL